jgi:hypothetical protein
LLWDDAAVGAYGFARNPHPGTLDVWRASGPGARAGAGTRVVAVRV